jgi:hypothetical protein
MLALVETAITLLSLFLALPLTRWPTYWTAAAS